MFLCVLSMEDERDEIEIKIMSVSLQKKCNQIHHIMFILGSDYNTRYSALCFIPQTISSVEGLAGLAELRDERMRRSKHGLKTQ